MCLFVVRFWFGFGCVGNGGLPFISSLGFGGGELGVGGFFLALILVYLIDLID